MTAPVNTTEITKVTEPNPTLKTIHEDKHSAGLHAAANYLYTKSNPVDEDFDQITNPTVLSITVTPTRIGSQMESKAH